MNIFLSRLVLENAVCADVLRIFTSVQGLAMLVKMASKNLEFSTTPPLKNKQPNLTKQTLLT